MPGIAVKRCRDQKRHQYRIDQVRQLFEAMSARTAAVHSAPDSQRMASIRMRATIKLRRVMGGHPTPLLRSFRFTLGGASEAAKSNHGLQLEFQVWVIVVVLSKWIS